MALANVAEVVTLQADTVIDEEVVANYNCRIGEDGIAGPINTYIRNEALFLANRTIIRADTQEFQFLAWDVEDRNRAVVTPEA